MIENKSLHTTLHIKHLADNTNIKHIALNKHSNGLLRNHFEIPNIS